MRFYDGMSRIIRKDDIKGWYHHQYLYDNIAAAGMVLD